MSRHPRTNTHTHRHTHTHTHRQTHTHARRCTGRHIHTHTTRKKAPIWPRTNPSRVWSALAIRGVNKPLQELAAPALLKVWTGVNTPALTRACSCDLLHAREGLALQHADLPLWDEGHGAVWRLKSCIDK